MNIKSYYIHSIADKIKGAYFVLTGQVPVLYKVVLDKDFYVFDEEEIK